MPVFDSGLVLKSVVTKEISFNQSTATQAEFVVDAPAGTEWLDVSVVKADISFGKPADLKALGHIGYDAFPELDKNGKLVINNEKAKVLLDGALHGAEKPDWSMTLLVQVKRFGKIA
jgi:hypothetical protein